MTQNEIHGIGRLVLASASPRRQQLLEHVGFAFEVVVPNVDEDAVPTSMPPSDYVQELAKRKAFAGATLVKGAALVIGCDTTVVIDGRVLNKPRDAAEATAMLGLLSGRTHTVFTGISIVDTLTSSVFTDVSATDVTFRELRQIEIATYVESGSPMDKAGAYGIQDDAGALFVERVNGCYYTVVGLPLSMLSTMLFRVHA